MEHPNNPSQPGHSLESVGLQKIRIRVILFSIFAGTLILATKFLAYRYSGSTALKSDAIESIVNVVASSFALFAVIFADKPADDEHPYGHGKMEFVSAAFEGGLISLASVMIIYEAFNTLWTGVHLQDLSTGLYLNLSAGALNGLLGAYLIFMGKKTHSMSIEADGRHVLSDFVTTLGLGVGLFIAKFTGWHWLDPVLALVVGLLLGRTGWGLVREASAGLLDEANPKMIDTLVKAYNKLSRPEIITIHELRSLRSGRYIHVDVHVTVPEFFEVGRAHDLVEKFGFEWIKELGIPGEVHAHVDPCARLYCESCRIENCPVRQKPFKPSQDTMTAQKAVAAGPPHYHAP